ncbi:uncharacterized protein TNCV_3450941 [Trichonephila clavipes]|uniref:Uncharacterized protein n=1 Tax=Trichonephila clavipes TaxID=2585209 RepID=A0A8X7BLG9_TRICX|nr:uncharacterized protein TNCV_3450941 [Trichonephila clavipes]
MENRTGTHRRKRFPGVNVVWEIPTALSSTEIDLYQIQHSLFVVWRSYASLTFLCVHDEASAVEQSLVQVRKEYQHISKLSFRETFYPSTTLSACEMKLPSERGDKNHVYACTVI